MEIILQEKILFLHKLINLAGAKNAGEDAVQWKYSLEKIIEKKTTHNYMF